MVMVPGSLDRLTSLELLFQLLDSMARQHRQGTFVVSAEGGATVGALTLVDGKLQLAVARGSFGRLIAAVEQSYPAASGVRAAAEAALERGDCVWAALGEALSLPPRELEQLACRVMGGEALTMVVECPGALGQMHLPHDAASRSSLRLPLLDVFLAAAAAAAGESDDLPSRLFHAYREQVDCAILLTTEVAGPPLPIAGVGLDSVQPVEPATGGPLSAVVGPLSKAANDFLSGASLLASYGMVLSMEKGSWVMAQSPQHVVLMRAGNSQLAARIISSLKQHGT